MFSVRILTTDHYQSTPLPDLDVLHSEFRATDVYKVPVIRVYGATPGGQKTCMHVHGVFPYLYVPYNGTQPWDRYMRQFASSVDKAVNVAQGHAASNIQHVYKISLVSGIPMYGYHDKEQQFLKIYLYNPGIIRKVADLLLGGAVMNQVFQPHESHIPYTLQMFIDYNLYGMNMLNVAAVKFRRKREDDNGNIIGSQESDGRGTGSRQPLSLSNTPHTGIHTGMWGNDNITSDLYLDPGIERQSTCELEVDVVAVDILNRMDVDVNVGTNPGLAALWEDEKQRRRDRGESSQITPPESQEHENAEITESDREHQERFHEIVLEHQPYMDSQSDTSETSQEEDICPTPASEVDLHMSQTEDDMPSSQDTVDLDEEDEVTAPVISLESIKRVVSFSQSFTESPTEVLPSSQPQRSSQDLAEILASLAEESSPACSQAAASQIEALEDQDSLLHDTSMPPDPEGVTEDSETLEMSQRMWGDDHDPTPGPSGVGEGGYNWAGMDDTWNDSQMKEPEEEEDEDEETIPQFDGAVDEKPANKPKARKRLEASGSTMPNYNQMGQQQSQSQLPYQQDPGQSMNQGQYSNQSQQMLYGEDSQFIYGNQENTSMRYNQGYQSQQAYNYGMDGNYGNSGTDNFGNGGWSQNYQQLQEMSTQQSNVSMASWDQGNQGWGGDMATPSPAQQVQRRELQSPTEPVLSPLETLQTIKSSQEPANSPSAVLHSPHSSLPSPLSMRQSPTIQSPPTSMHSMTSPMPSPRNFTSMQPMQTLQSPASSSISSQLDPSERQGPQHMGDYSGTDNQGYGSYTQHYYGNQGDYTSGGYGSQYSQNYNTGGYPSYNQYHGNQQHGIQQQPHSNHGNLQQPHGNLSNQQHPLSNYSNHQQQQQQQHQNQQHWQMQQFPINHSQVQPHPMAEGMQKKGTKATGRKLGNAGKSTAKKTKKAKKAPPLPSPTPLGFGSSALSGNKVVGSSRIQESPNKPQSTLERLLMCDDEDDGLMSQEPMPRSMSRCSNISTASSLTSIGPTTPILANPISSQLSSPLSPFEAMAAKGQPQKIADLLPPQKIADLLTQVNPLGLDVNRRSSFGDNILESSQMSSSSVRSSQEDLFMDTSNHSLSSPVHQDRPSSNSFSKPPSQTSQSPKHNYSVTYQASPATTASSQQGNKSDTFSCLQSLQSLVSSVSKDPSYGVSMSQEDQFGNYQTMSHPAQSHQIQHQGQSGQHQNHPQGHQQQPQSQSGQQIHQNHPQGHQQQPQGHPGQHQNHPHQQPQSQSGQQMYQNHPQGQQIHHNLTPDHQNHPQGQQIHHNLTTDHQNHPQGQQIHQNYPPGHPSQQVPQSHHPDPQMGYQEFTPPYSGNRNTYHQQHHQQSSPYWNRQNSSPVSHGNYSPMGNSSPYGMMEHGTPPHGSVQFSTGRHQHSSMSSHVAGPSDHLSPKLMRSLSAPSVIKKRGRPRKYDMPLNPQNPQSPQIVQPPLTSQSPTHPQARSRSNSVADKIPISKPPPPNPSYTFSFQVPTPVFKRLKFHKKRPLDNTNTVNFVRMHPRDARRYSLLKIGREIVKAQNFSSSDIETAVLRIKSENRNSAHNQSTDSLVTSNASGCVDNEEQNSVDVTYTKHGNTLAQDMFGVVPENVSDSTPAMQDDFPDNITPVFNQQNPQQITTTMSSMDSPSIDPLSPQKQSLKDKLSANISNLNLKKVLHEHMAMKRGNECDVNADVQKVTEGMNNGPTQLTRAASDCEDRDFREESSIRAIDSQQEVIQGDKLVTSVKTCTCDPDKCVCEEEEMSEEEQESEEENKKEMYENNLTNGTGQSHLPQSSKGGSRSQPNSFLGQFQSFLSKGYSSSDSDTGNPTTEKNGTLSNTESGEQEGNMNDNVDRSPDVCPKSPDICPKSPNVCPRSPDICPKSPDVCPRSPNICPGSPAVCPRSPDVQDKDFAADDADRLSSTQTNGLPGNSDEVVSGAHTTIDRMSEGQSSSQMLRNHMLGTMADDPVSGGRVEGGQRPEHHISGQIQGHISGNQMPRSHMLGGQMPGVHMSSGKKSHMSGHMQGSHMPRSQMPDQMLGGHMPGGQMPGGQMLGGQMPGGQMPGGQMPGGPIPRGQMPGGQMPRSQMPEDHLPGGNMPRGQMPRSQMPRSQIPGDQMSGGQMPRGQITGQIPRGRMPGNLMPRSQMPGGQMPRSQIPNQLPGGHMPRSRIPRDHLPGGHMPRSQIPDQLPGGHMPRSQIPDQLPGGHIPRSQIPDQLPGGHMPRSRIPGDSLPGGHMPRSQIPDQLPGGHMPRSQIPEQLPGGHMPRSQIADQLPGGHMPGNNPGNNLPGGHMPGSQMPGGHVPSGRMPGGHMPGGRMTGSQMPGDHVPSGRIPGGHMPGGRMPGGHMPGSQITIEQLSECQMPRGQVPGGQMLRGQVPGGQMPRGQVPGGQMPGAQMPGGQMPRGQVPGGQMPRGHVPGGQMPRGHVPGGQMSDHIPKHIPGGFDQVNGGEIGMVDTMEPIHNTQTSATQYTDLKKFEEQNTGHFLGLSDQGGFPSGHKKESLSGNQSRTIPRPGVRDYSHTRNIFEKLLNSKINEEILCPAKTAPSVDMDKPQGVNTGNLVISHTTSHRTEDWKLVNKPPPNQDRTSQMNTATYGGIHNSTISSIIEKVLVQDKLARMYDRKVFNGDGVDGGSVMSAAVSTGLVSVGTTHAGLENIRHKAKGLKVVRRRNLSTKRRFKVTANGHIHSLPPVIDPDMDEVQNVILKDVNLTEASNGILTPIKSQTPVAGRSPIRQSCTGLGLENYKLFDSDIICNHNELEAKLQALKKDLECPSSQSSKIYSNMCVSEEDLPCQGRMASPFSVPCSEMSSRTTSRKDSSESSANVPAGNGKSKLKLRKRNSSNSMRDRRENSRPACRSRKATSTDNSGSDMDFIFEKENKEITWNMCKRKKKREVAGVDYIVIGRFKGHRKMSVRLERLDIEEDEIVNVKDFLVEQSKQNHADLASENNKDDVVLLVPGNCKEEESGIQLHQDIAKPNSDSSEESWCCQSSPEKNPRLRTEICDDWSNDSKEQQADIDSDDPKSSPKNRKRKKLTRNQKLQTAFLSKKSRRRKAPAGAKLSHNLSLLHEATLANLNDTRLAYSENTEDFKVKYKDAMFKMSFISSSDSDKGNNSPPLPVSPEELARDRQGLTRSTSDVLSPVLPVSDNSQSPVYSQIHTMLRMRDKTGSDLSPIYRPIMKEVNMCTDNFQQFSSVQLRNPCSAVANQGLRFRDCQNGIGLSALDVQSEDSMDCAWSESQNSNSSVVSLSKTKFKKAVVKLKPLSSADIVNFCGKSDSNLEKVRSPVSGKPSSNADIVHFSGTSNGRNLSNLEKFSSPVVGKTSSPVDIVDFGGTSNNQNPSSLEKGSSILYVKQMSVSSTSTDGRISPPDLGPPNIPKYPKTCQTTDDSRSPPPLLSTVSSRPPLSHVSPPQTPQGHVGFGLFELKSPASSCSTGSLNVVHSDRFSDISDDDEEEVCLRLDTDDDDDDDDDDEESKKSPWIPHRPMANGVSVPSTTGSSSDGDMPSLTRENNTTPVDPFDCVSSVLRKCVGHNNNDQTKSPVITGNNSNSSEQSAGQFLTVENGTSNNKTDQSCPNPEKVQDSISAKCRKILTPDILPPSKVMVQNTATSHGLNSAVILEAFCSNPEDLPEQPRELGGRLLGVRSTRVKDYSEFVGYSGHDGLLAWRSRMMESDKIISSQSENETLMSRIEKDPQLRYALLGDRHIVISPCNPPPKTESVSKWLEGRKLWKELKNMDKGIKSNTETNDEKNKEIIQSNTENTLTNVDDRLSASAVSDNEKVCDPKLTRELSYDDVYQNDTVNDSVDVKDTKMDITRTLFDEADGHSSSDDSDVIGPSPSSGLRLSQFSSSRLLGSRHKNVPTTGSDMPVTGSDTPVTRTDTHVTGSNIPVTGSDTPVARTNTPVTPYVGTEVSRERLHSTPVHRKRLSGLFNSAFTPVTHNKPTAMGTPNEEAKRQLNCAGGKSSTSPGIFSTPKRVPLPKRLSTNTKQSLDASQLQQFATPRDQKGHTSQIDAPTPQNSFGFKVGQENLQEAKALHEVQNLTVLSLELHAETRGDLRPDPEVDAVKAVFYSIANDVDPAKGKRQVTGVIVVDIHSADADRALKERKKTSQQSPTSTPGQSDSPQPSTSRSRSPQPSTSRSDSPQPSTSRARSRSPVPARGKSPKPSTSKSRTPSPKPSTPRGRKAKVKGPVTPPPRQFDRNEDIPPTLLQRSGIDLGDLEVTYVRDEEELCSVFLDIVIAKWDPDILVGYEIQNFSWGYLFQRAAHLSIPLCKKMSRIPGEKTGSHFSATKDEYGADHMSEIHVVGRVVLNLWRILRHEVTLNIYSYENVAYHVLHQRIAQYSFRTLSSWFNHRTHLYRWRLIDYFVTRVKGNLQIIDQLDLVGRTSEFARVFGIEFYHVLSRGSQYRVESMMLRLAKPLNFIAVSPNVHQRSRMRAPECISLTLEPESRFYADPVVVVDFQSLYPSIMIGHNYCFSTCLGRVKWLDKAHEGPIEFGCTHLNVPPAVMKKLQNDITVSPNGVVFVKQHVRKGVISAMVEEILNTRIMVKKAMKEYKKDKALCKLLDARQMGLKLIANVTYGYTAANFSGRMPCIEVADSIVRKARETLERAIKLVEDTPHWGARVVYGDTDSMFIELKGRSKEEAFKIGYEICDAVTAANPKPMKLRFEKVYLPCILQTKKRYVGFSYETLDQKEPIFDAKGIETVRRDACPAVAKILERTIKTLFTTRDVSQAKQYVQTQCRKVMEGKVSLQDLVFAKEYRGMAGYKAGACVPALDIAKKCLHQDRRGEPRVGERVPYVIVYGSPGLPLIQLVKRPSELLTDPALRINSTYYISKQILPPLNRIFSLMGVNVFSWYTEMPKVTRIAPQAAMAPDKQKGTISQFFSVVSCPVCEEQTNQDICNKCARDPQKVAVTLNDRIREWDQVYSDLTKICNSCMGVQDDAQPCVSLDCPILFRRRTAKVDVLKGQQLRGVAIKVLDF